MLSLLLLLSSSITHTNLSAPLNLDRVRHFECFNVVRIVDHAIRKHQNTAAITDELQAHCSKLDNPRKDVCQALVPSRVANISAQLTAKNRPDVICESLGYVRHFSEGRAVSPDRCAAIVDIVKRESSKEQLPPKDAALKLPRPFGKRGEGRLFGFSTACKEVAPDERVVCHVISRILSKEPSKEIDRDAGGVEICKQLSAKHLIKLVNATGEAKKV